MGPLDKPPGPLMLQRLSEVHEPQRLDAVRESLPDLVDTFHWCSAPYTEAANSQYVASCQQNWCLMREFAFAVYDRAAGRFVGEAAIDDLDPEAGSANLSYWIAKSLRRRGYASMAVAAIARFAFRDLGLRELRLLVASDNVASVRVARKLGARPLALAPAEAPAGTPACDAVRFVLEASRCTGLLRRDRRSDSYKTISEGG